MNTFFSEQFSYCSVTWIFHNRSFNHKINRLHELYHPIVFNNNYSSFVELPETDRSSSRHHRNLNFFALEMFRVYKRTAPNILNEAFPLNPELS